MTVPSRSETYTLGTKVVGLIVTYSDRAELCVETSSAARRAGAEQVVIIANNVTARSERILRKYASEDAGINLVANPVNVGSAGGFSQGIPRALCLGADLVWMLDDDNVPDSDALRILLAGLTILSSDSEGRLVPAVASRRSYANFTLPAPGSSLNFDFRRYLRSTRSDEKSAGAKLPMGDEMSLEEPFMQIQSAPYGGLLLHRSTIEAIGLPNAALVLYQDDVEYTTRIPLAGGRIYLSRDSRVRDMEPAWPHRGSGRGPMLLMTAGDDLRIYYYVRNRTLLDRRQARSFSERTALLTNSAIFIIFSAVAALRARCPRRFVTVVRAMRHGFRADLTHSPPLS